MEKFKDVNEILDFAIAAEQEAVEFYTGLAAQAKNAGMKRVFEEFAAEEMGHKARLMRIRETGIMESAAEKVSDLKVADYLVAVKPGPEMVYQDALVLAMKKEKAAFRLYTGLAEKMTNTELRDLFQSLALEESKHKLRFELEYDEYVLRDN